MNYLEKISKRLSKDNFNERFKTDYSLSLNIKRKNNITNVEFRANRSLRSGCYKPLQSRIILNDDIKELSLFFEYVFYPNIEDKFSEFVNKINEEHKQELQILYEEEEMSLFDDLFGFSYPLLYRWSYDLGMMKEGRELKEYANDYALYSILDNTLGREIIFLKEIKDSFEENSYFTELNDYIIRTKQLSSQFKNKLLQEYNIKKKNLQGLMNIKSDKEDFDDSIFIFN